MEPVTEEGVGKGPKVRGLAIGGHLYFYGSMDVEGVRKGLDDIVGVGVG